MLTNELKAQLDVALNEATLLGLEVDTGRQLAAATLAMLSLPADDGPMPTDARVQFLFRDVSRVVASLRLGIWNDESAAVVPFPIDQLLQKVQSFEGLPVYGWKFFDTAAEELSKWGDRLSLDWRSPSLKSDHSIVLFQEGAGRHIDLCLWFGDLEARDPGGNVLDLNEIAAAGKRWWDAFFANDPRTQGMGMAPLKGDKASP
jgi:hypothetical protein